MKSMGEIEYRDFLFREFIRIGDENPKYIYKYLDIDGGLKSLEYLTLQFSHPYTFKDKTEFKKKSRIDFKGQGEAIRKSFYSDEINQYEKMSADQERNINLRTDEELSDFAETWEDDTKSSGVACFTTLENSEFHWEKYGKNGTGICIRYDLSKLLKFLRNSNNFRYQGQSKLRDSPVIYVPNIQPIKFQMDSHSKLLISINWYLVKSKEHEDEMEFRLYSNECNIIDTYQRVRVPKNSIDRVYLGFSIDLIKAKEVKKLGFLMT